MQHADTLQKVYTFLGVRDSTVMPPAETVFATTQRSEVSPANRTWMRRRFAREVSRLERMLGRSFDQWRG